MEDNHKIERTKTYWTSYGKFGENPPIVNQIADLNDSHLMRLVFWLRKRKPFLGSESEHKDILRILENEIEYRTINKIFVHDLY